MEYLGVPVIDQAHRVIFKLLDGLERLPRPAFDNACQQLIKEFIEDLNEENRLMDDLDYPQAPEHRAAHDRLLEALHNAVHLLRRGDEQSARRAVHFLPEWIDKHINTMDLALAVALLRAKAGQPA